MELELKHQYAADENEREDTAKHFLNKFKNRSEKKFIFKIGPYGDSSITETIIAYLESRFDVIKVEKSEENAFFARLDFYIEAQLKPMRVNYKNMLRISNALYDLGLAFTNLNLGQISVEPEGYINSAIKTNNHQLRQYIIEKPIMSIYLAVIFLFTAMLLLSVFLSFFIPRNFVSRNYINETIQYIPIFSTLLFVPLAFLGQRRSIFSKKLGNSIFTRMIKASIFNIFILGTIFITTSLLSQTQINFFMHKKSNKKTETLQFRVEKVYLGKVRRGCWNAIILKGSDLPFTFSRSYSKRVCGVSDEMANKATHGSKIYLTGSTSKFGIFVDSYRLE